MDKYEQIRTGVANSNGIRVTLYRNLDTMAYRVRTSDVFRTYSDRTFFGSGVKEWRKDLAAAEKIERQ